MRLTEAQRWKADAAAAVAAVRESESRFETKVEEAQFARMQEEWWETLPANACEEQLSESSAQTHHIACSTHD